MGTLFNQFINTISGFRPVRSKMFDRDGLKKFDRADRPGWTCHRRESFFLNHFRAGCQTIPAYVHSCASNRFMPLHDGPAGGFRSGELLLTWKHPKNYQTQFLKLNGEHQAIRPVSPKFLKCLRRWSFHFASDLPVRYSLFANEPIFFEISSAVQSES
jgi:hypothetical protein